MSDRKENYIEKAIQLLCSGVRPTADMLVSYCGGSKATALAALQQVWESHLPALLNEKSTFSPEVPLSVQQAAENLWATANEAAKAAAVEPFNRLNIDFEIAKAQLTNAQEAQAELREKCDALARGNDELNSILQAARADLRSANEALEDAAAGRKAADAKAAALQEELTAARAQAVESIKIVTDALKESHASAIADLESKAASLEAQLENALEARNQAQAATLSAGQARPSTIKQRLTMRRKGKPAAKSKDSIQ